MVATNVFSMVRLPGKGRQIHLNRFDNPVLLGVDTEGVDTRFYNWERKNWAAKFEKKALKVAMDSTNRPWILSSQGEIWQFRGSLGWARRAQGVKDFDIGHDNSIFMIGQEYSYQDTQNQTKQSNLYVWRSGEFIPANEGGRGEKVRVDQKGNPWVLTSGGSLRFKNAEGNWELIQASLRDFDVNSLENLYGIEKAHFVRTNGSLVKYQSGGFVNVGGYGNQISLSYTHRPFVINDLYEVWGEGFSFAKAEDFGFASMTANGKPNLGTRPILIIPVRYADTVFSARLVQKKINDLFFDFSGQSMTIESYFREMSYGKFQISPAETFPRTLVHPLKMHCAHRSKEECPEAPGGKMQTAFNELMDLPEVEQYDFSQFDKNGDQKITDDELILVFFQAALDPFKTGGINRGFPDGCAKTTRLKKIKLCTRMVLIAEHTGKSTIAHEIAHSLGAEDIYGSFSRMNYAHSLMGGTVSSNYDQHEYFHLDPWHKMRLGWIRPTIYPLSVAQSSFAPEEFTLDVAVQSSEPRVLLVYDPSLGTEQGYMLEYRRPELMSFDQNTYDQGVRAWYFKTGQNFYLQDRPAIILPGKNDRLDSEIEAQSDDQVVLIDGREHIDFGPNQLLESMRKKGSDDVMSFDKALVTLNYDPLSSYLLMGRGGAYNDVNTPVTINWPDEIKGPIHPPLVLKVNESPSTAGSSLKISIH